MDIDTPMLIKPLPFYWGPVLVLGCSTHLIALLLPLFLEMETTLASFLTSLETS